MVGLRWTAALGTSVVSYAFDYRVYAPGKLQDGWTWDYYTGYVDSATGGRQRQNTCRWPEDACASQRGPYDVSASMLSGHKASAVYWGVMCATDLAADCPIGYEANVKIKSARFTVEDENPPRITSVPRGELVDSSGVASGAADVSFSATDVGGGLFEATVEIDGAPVLKSAIDQQGGKCVLPFRDPAPCADAAVVGLSVDTTSLADGPHTVRLLVSDATGTNVALYGPIEILTANGIPPSIERLQAISCTPSATRDLSLTVRHHKIAYGRAVTVTGRVSQPPADAVVLIAGEISGGVGTGTRLDAKGRFKAHIRPSHSQRIRTVLLAPGSAPRCSRKVRISVKAKSTLKASRTRLHNRDSLQLSGLVAGVPIPPRGKSLIIRVRGTGSSQWYRAGALRTDEGGRWSWRYRFKRTSHKTTYVFRAVVPRQSGFPFASGHSRAARVTVVP